MERKSIIAAALAVALLSSTTTVSASFVFGYTNSNVATNLLLGLVGGGSVTLSTGESTFDPDVLNQGWWSPNSENYDSNTNIIVGNDGESLYNNFFTFDLSGLSEIPSESVVSATLRINDTGSGQGPFPVIYSLFDVSTDAATLNANDGSSLGIYSDLGSGVNFASVLMASNPAGPFDIALNANAIAAISASIGGYFSIGGTLAPTSAVPLPTALPLLLSGLVGMGFLARRRQRSSS